LSATSAPPPSGTTIALVLIGLVILIPSVFLTGLLLSTGYSSGPWLAPYPIATGLAVLCAAALRRGHELRRGQEALPRSPRERPRWTNFSVALVAIGLLFLLWPVSDLATHPRLLRYASGQSRYFDLGNALTILFMGASMVIGAVLVFAGLASRRRG
jgi:hypothetical protein